jgi:4-amino-4-deoxy-L-arabinose transferase-like glycosyltransferase
MLNAMTKDKVFTWRFCLCCGIFIWFIINLLQGVFTAIHEDEAYYALFGEHLAWGYFDHPPMVGLMAFLSSIFFSGTLGVRFFTIIASCLSLWVIWKIAVQVQNDAKMEKPILFFVLAFSIVMFNIYGFVTTPDSSLILLSALFLLVYQHFLADKSWKNALLMGLIMALMVYSKYHAFLLLGLIVLSNLKLLKD